MGSWFRKKPYLEKLKEKYTLLMKKSFEVAKRDIKESKKIHRQADELFQKIKYLTLQQADK